MTLRYSFQLKKQVLIINQGNLCDLLEVCGIQYVWIETLGGFRHRGTDQNSPNTGLKAPAFRNYGDHMMTEAFRGAVRELLIHAEKQATTLMCAERFFWKCHRRLLSDFLVAQGVGVKHILETGNVRPHKLTTGAIVTDERTVVYP